MQWHMRLSARPPSSYARTTVLVLVLSMISGTSIQAAPTTSLPVPAPISTTGTTTAPRLTTSTTVTAPKLTTSTTKTSTMTTSTTTIRTTTTSTTTTSKTTTSTTAAAAPPQTITSTTTALKPTTTTTTAPPETITTTNNVAPPPTITNTAPTPTTPIAAPPPATTNVAPLPATTNTTPPPATPNAATSTALEPTPEMAVSTSTLPPNPTASNKDFSLLYKCSPLGSDQCSFSKQSNVGLQSYSLFVGSPLSNCHNGTAAIDSEISGSISTSDTWSPGLSVGLQLGPLNLQSSFGWSHSTTRTYSQRVTIHVPPAQQGALIAIVTYNVSSGHMKIGSTDVYPVFSNQPTGNVKYDAAVIGCDDTFNANYSAPLPISGSLQRSMSSSTLFMSVILVGITYML